MSFHFSEDSFQDKVQTIHYWLGQERERFKSVVKDLLFFFGPIRSTLRRTYSYIYT